MLGYNAGVMDRRRFLTMGAALVGGIALEQAIPFNRVWSFPKEIRMCHHYPGCGITESDHQLLLEIVRKYRRPMDEHWREHYRHRDSIWRESRFYTVTELGLTERFPSDRIAAAESRSTPCPSIRLTGGRRD